MVALLFMGGAAVLLSCNSKKSPNQTNPETLVTMRGENLTSISSKNGNKTYLFKAALMETYGQAKEPYTLYPDGLSVETYKDTTGVVESTLRADEAVYYEKRKLWMTSGNVVASGSGRTLYTQQLFWDEKTDRIYSNVFSRIVDVDGEHTGQGFESDKDLKQWIFRDYEGTVAVDTSPVDEESGESSPEAGASQPSPSNSGTSATTTSVPMRLSTPGQADQDKGRFGRAKTRLSDDE